MRARPLISLPASSSMSAASSAAPTRRCATARPNSGSRPRMRLMQAVRSALKPSRRRCTHSMLCCSMLLTGTKRMCGRHAASQIAAASLASFLPLCALAAVRRDQVRGDDARVQPHGEQLARPVVGAGTGLHRDHAARRQLRAPGQELVAAQRPVRQHATARIDGMHLDHALGQRSTPTRAATPRVILSTGLPLSMAAD